MLWSTLITLGSSYILEDVKNETYSREQKHVVLFRERVLSPKIMQLFSCILSLQTWELSAKARVWSARTSLLLRRCGVIRDDFWDAWGSMRPTFAQWKNTHLLCRWWSREIFASYWSACISCRFCLQPSSYLCPHHTILVIEWVCTWCVLVHGNTTNKSARRRLVAPVNHYVGIKRRSS